MLYHTVNSTMQYLVTPGYFGATYTLQVHQLSSGFHLHQTFEPRTPLCNYCNYCNHCTVQLNCSIILLFSLELKSASTEHRINLMLSYEVNAGQLLAKGLLWSGHVPAIQPPDITHWPQHPGMHHHQYQYPVPALRLALAVRNQIGNIDLHTLSAGTFSGNITHWTQ